MTVREYITDALTGFKIPASVFADLDLSGLDLEDEYSKDNYAEVGKGIVSALESMMFSPRRTNISENGFSESWNYADMGKMYVRLCKRYGLTPSDDVLEMSGISTVTEKTDIW